MRSRRDNLVAHARRLVREINELTRQIELESSRIASRNEAIRSAACAIAPDTASKLAG
jgi:hypothetical protein